LDEMDEIRQTFFQECDELMEALEAGLLTMSEGTGSDETINEVFRAVHSVKGGAGAFGLDDLVKFAHIFETTLDEVRSDRLEVSPELMKVLLQSSDVLADLVRAARDDTTTDATEAAALVIELEKFVGDTMQEKADEFANLDFQPLVLDLGFGTDDPEQTDDDPQPDVYEIQFRPQKGLYANGNETALLLRELARLGDSDVTCDSSALPELSSLDPEGAYLSWAIELETDRDLAAIREVFEFVETDCTLKISSGALTSQPVDIDLGPEPPLPVNQPATRELAAQPEQAKPAAVTPVKNPPDGNASAAPAVGETIRVNLEKVDRLINLVGELVINQAMLSEGVTEAGGAQETSVAQGLDEFRQLTREIQESVMAIRAQPVKSLFQRMSRIVREAAKATGKSVRLNIEGEATEVDKIVIERLADPLTHMIRNAVDHGLEIAEEREKSGKPEQGVVRLSAAHRSGKIVITVADDGAGIDRARVKQIAIDKNLIAADAQLSNYEIDNLLFLPGFSTVDKVSELSGRGVGMDVVKRAIQTLGGSISITSQPAKGSTFRISLPLTLAVLDGMVVRVAGQTLIAPLTSIVETLKPDRAAVHEMGADARVIRVRGGFIPIVDVGQGLGFRNHAADYRGCVALVIETDDGAQCALLVDEILDQRQVVIKSLEENYGHVPGIAAATILGDGRIALILDAEALVARASSEAIETEPAIAATG